MGWWVKMSGMAAKCADEVVYICVDLHGCSTAKAPSIVLTYIKVVLLLSRSSWTFHYPPSARTKLSYSSAS